MRKTHIILLLCAFFTLPSIQAQQTAFDEFRKEAGDYAALYTGKAEVSYNLQKYLNHPYWGVEEFCNGTIHYNGWLYTGIKLRYDTYKKLLIVVTPNKQTALQVDLRKVDYFEINGQKFVRQGDNYAALLYESPQLCLTQYIVSTLRTQIKKEDFYYSQFKKNMFFSLRKDGTDFTLSSRSDFLKLFPKIKKQLKAFCRKEKLSFREDSRAQDMIALTRYTDSLIHK